MDELRLVDITPADCADLPCCGIKNRTHPGKKLKNCWFERHYQDGLRAKVLLTPESRQVAYIEYLPGQVAWRGVDAKGYMFVHCLWSSVKKYKQQGLAGMLLDACLAEARTAGMKGVAAVARDAPWLAGPAVFLKNGFESVAQSPPDYQLMVRKLKPVYKDPKFERDFEFKLKEYQSALTIIRSDQCPHIAKFADEIEESARVDFGLVPEVVRLKSHTDARCAPTPYAVFALIYHGKLIADHPVSRTRFRNIMMKIRSKPLSLRVLSAR